eukprot:TRINITY_DN6425_c1_g1_i1.p1 TRINITY_DN6425_c1_g1~~TRINITY_DN6425_c1_g1_i1.p1  ORF type:complete len:331 (-),score=44.33 TRINITY_DN6425_c1_g1_i1:81-1073(-)
MILSISANLQTSCMTLLQRLRGFPSSYQESRGERSVFDNIALKLRHGVKQHQVQKPEGKQECGDLFGVSKHLYPNNSRKRWQFLYSRTAHPAKTDREVMDEIGKNLNISRWEDWYSVGNHAIRAQGGMRILRRHNSSRTEALTSIYPEFDWRIYKFDRVPDNYWEILANRRQFFDDLFKDLKLESCQDWYGVKCSEVYKRGGGGMFFEYYRASLAKALPALYPEHRWNLWNFSHVSRLPRMYWNDYNNVVAFMRLIAENMNVSKAGDWNHVTAQHIRHFGGASLLCKKEQGIVPLLSQIFSEQDWNIGRYPLRKHEVHFKKSIQRIFAHR